MTIIDAHVHLWDPGRLRYAWLQGSPLHHRVGVEELRAAVGAVREVIVVEADCAEEQGAAEVAWLVEQAERWPGIRGIVAYAPLHLGDAVASRLAALRDQPLVVGVRRLVQDEPPGFASRPGFRAGLDRLAEVDLPFDLCVRSSQLDEAIALVRDTPGVRFVLDHLGKPQVGLDPARWRDQLSQLAASPNVVCKFSGLMTEVVAGPGGPTAVRPYLSHALTAFGAGRCLFGSDWPVMTTATTYADWLAAVTTVVADDPEPVLAGTARRVYGLPPSPEARA